MKDNDEDRLDPAVINEFIVLKGQLATFHSDFDVLSKKHPDGAVGQFKLGILNEKLRKATAILGEEYRPFPEFEEFKAEDIPTSSDVVMVLSQYLTSMALFTGHNTYSKRDLDYQTRTYWHAKGGALNEDGSAIADYEEDEDDDDDDGDEEENE
jgi:hypothetical protein